VQAAQTHQTCNKALLTSPQTPLSLSLSPQLLPILFV